MSSKSKMFSKCPKRTYVSEAHVRVPPLYGYSKSQYIFTTTSFQEGPHYKFFFHLQESEDERRTRVDENIGNDLACFLTD